MANVKTVGLRQIPKSLQDWQNEIPAVSFPDDLEAADGDLGAGSLARQKTATAAIAMLQPSGFAAFKMLRPHFSRELGQLAAGGHKLCVIVRTTEKSWIHPISVALTACLLDLAADLDADLPTVDVRTVGIDRSFGNRGFDVNSIVRNLSDRHVLVPVLTSEELPPVIEALADLDLDGIPSRSAMRAAVNRRFPGSNWKSSKALPEYVQPGDFDLALHRSTSAEYAFELLEKLGEVSAQAAATKAEAKAAEAEKEKEAEARLRAKQASVTKILRPTEPRLEDLHGYGQAAVWATDLVRDLHDYRDGKLDWADVDAGCLLSGPPGTGKTLFASALAASAGLPFVATSYADWQSQGDGHLGYVIKCVRTRFSDAIAAAPAILFIDEIDVVGTRGARGDHDGWWSAVITALLEALDGTTRREGLAVIGACNDPSRIDPALLRSGRLDRRFEIGLPDENSLARIFAHHLPDGDAQTFETVATVLAGTTSGADVSRIAREARRVARRAGREIVADDLLSIAMPADRLNARDRRLAAIHEAGHAVVAMAQGERVNTLSLVSGNGAHGGVYGSHSMGMARAGEMESFVVGLLAGRAAEEVILGEPSGGASGDLEQATKIVSSMLGNLGLGGRLSTYEQVAMSDVETRLQALYGRTLRLVAEHRAAIEALAEIAIDRRVLGRRALSDFARDRGLGGSQ